MEYRRFLFIILLIPILVLKVSAQYRQSEPGPPTTRILFVLDCSQSMAAMWQSDKKINIARRFLIHSVDSLELLENLQLGLRVYGHQSPVPPQDCNDTKLEVPFADGNAGKIRQKLRYLNPKGTTPIARSLALTVGDFPPCDNCRNIVILITDGKEACDGDPCEVSRDLQKSGILLKPFIIGIGLDPEFRKTYDCVGSFFNAAGEDDFQEVLGVVITHVLGQTTAQVNLLDSYGNPSETNVPMTFYDQVSGKVKYNFVHTINFKGNPDTIALDPLVKYRLVVHTIPPVEVTDILLTQGKHNHIGADAPMGILLVTTAGGAQYRDVQFVVKSPNDRRSLNWQDVNTEERYLVGRYEVEVPILPKLIIPDVEIQQSSITKIELPRPGIVNILKNVRGYGSIFLEKEKDNTLEWVYNINKESQNETITLQPGTYRFIFRPMNSRKSIYTIDKRFVVKPGGSDVIKLY